MGGRDKENRSIPSLVRSGVFGMPQNFIRGTWCAMKNTINYLRALDKNVGEFSCRKRGWEKLFLKILRDDIGETIRKIEDIQYGSTYLEKLKEKIPYC